MAEEVYDGAIGIDLGMSIDTSHAVAPLSRAQFPAAFHRAGDFLHRNYDC